MVYKENDRATWMQPCIFKNGAWIPLGRPFLSAIAGSKIKTTDETKKAREEKVLQKGKEEMQVKLDSFANIEVQEEEL